MLGLASSPLDDITATMDQRSQLQQLVNFLNDFIKTKQKPDIALSPNDATRRDNTLAQLEAMLTKTSLWEYLHEVNALDGEAEHLHETSLVSLLTTLPDKVSNATNGLSPVFFLPENYFARLSRQVAEIVIVSDISGREAKMYFAGQLVAKLIRLGHAKILIDQWYPFLYRQIMKSHSQETLMNLWKLLSTMDMETTSLDKFFVALIHRNTPIHTKNINKRVKFLFAIVESAPSAIQGAVSRLFGSKLFTSSTYLLSVPINTLYVLAHVFSRFFISSKTTFTDPPTLKHTLTLQSVIKTILKTWSDPVFVRHGSPRTQRILTQFILISLPILASVDESCLKTGELITFFFNGVQHYLESHNPDTRILGMVLAEEWSKKAAKKNQDGETSGLLDFELPKGNQDICELRNLAVGIDIGHDDNDGVDDEIDGLSDSLKSELQLQLNSRKLTGTIKNAPLPKSTAQPKSQSLRYPVQRVPDSDDEDSSSDEFQSYAIPESEKRHASTNLNTKTEEPTEFISPSDKPKPPRYIHDCVEYLRADDVEKMDLGLQHIVSLIVKMSDKQVAETCLELARILVYLEDKYDLESYPNRFDALVALTTRCPRSVPPFLACFFYDRNLGMRQRTEILDVVVKAARELSSIDSSKEAEQTPSMKQLRPVNQHKSKTKTEDIASQIIHERIEAKTRRFSTKSKVESTRKSPTKNRFADCAGDFLFPFIQGFGTGTHVDKLVGRDDASRMLVEKLCMSLSIVVYCAVGTPQIVSIVKEFWQFIWSLRYFISPAFTEQVKSHPNHTITEANMIIPNRSPGTSSAISSILPTQQKSDSDVRHALLFSLMVFLESAPRWLLKSEMQHCVISISEFLEESFKSETREDTLSLCAVVAGLINEIREEIGRDIFGENWTG